MPRCHCFNGPTSTIPHTDGVLNADEVRKALSNRSVLVWGFCRKGRSGQMPKTPASVFGPGLKTPILRGMVVAISRDGAVVRLEDDLGNGGWVPVDALLYRFDRL
jgi:hypothetical protein